MNEEAEKLWEKRRQRAEQIRQFNERAVKFSGDPNYRGIGGDLNDGTMIVAMGAMRAMQDEKSKD